MSPRVDALLDLLRKHGYHPAFARMIGNEVELRVPWPTKGVDDLYIRAAGDTREQAAYESLKEAARKLGVLPPDGA